MIWLYIFLSKTTNPGSAGKALKLYSTHFLNSDEVQNLVKEPWHEKANTINLRRVKTQMSLSIDPVCPESSLLLSR